MKAKGKRIISIILVSTFLGLGINSYAKERRGAELSIWIKNGPAIKGELIAVIMDKDLMLKLKSGEKLTIQAPSMAIAFSIYDIRVIKIDKMSTKKSRIFLGAGIGLLAGLSSSLAFGSHKSRNPGVSIGLSGIVGALVGGGIGKSIKKDEILWIERMSESEIKMTLEKLRTIALSPD